MADALKSAREALEEARDLIESGSCEAHVGDIWKTYCDDCQNERRIAERISEALVTIDAAQDEETEATQLRQQRDEAIGLLREAFEPSVIHCYDGQHHYDEWWRRRRKFLARLDAKKGAT